jgi:2-dehydro-3-deoxy-D-arabinonate dehydratase
MKLCRFADGQGQPRIGCLTDDSSIRDLTPAGIDRMEVLLEAEDCLTRISQISHATLPQIPVQEVKLLAPIERQEIWAAGVTYLRSKKARMEESEFSATAYDRVYEAERPELFFKSMPEKAVAMDEPIGIRRDARWSVPEPELALVINSHGKIAGYTIGNDMSSRDIEGENLLYLPQAKIYRGSCALGPWIELGVPETAAREWKIRLEIRRADRVVFSGETSVSQIKRGFEQLVEFLYRSQVFCHGAVLLTGTGVVPPDGFTLAEHDSVQIEITGIGVLRNPVITV